MCDKLEIPETTIVKSLLKSFSYVFTYTNYALQTMKCELSHHLMLNYFMGAYNCNVFILHYGIL